jgi:hypothetical protein
LILDNDKISIESGNKSGNNGIKRLSYQYWYLPRDLSMKLVFSNMFVFMMMAGLMGVAAHDDDLVFSNMFVFMMMAGLMHPSNRPSS